MPSPSDFVQIFQTVATYNLVACQQLDVGMEAFFWGSNKLGYVKFGERPISQIMTESSKLTAGQLNSEFIKKFPNYQEIERKISDGIDARNNFCHKLFAGKNSSFENFTSGYEIKFEIDRLRKLINDANEIIGIVLAIYNSDINGDEIFSKLTADFKKLSKLNHEHWG